MGNTYSSFPAFSTKAGVVVIDSISSTVTPNSITITVNSSGPIDQIQISNDNISDDYSPPLTVTSKNINNSDPNYVIPDNNYCNGDTYGACLNANGKSWCNDNCKNESGSYYPSSQYFVSPSGSNYPVSWTDNALGVGLKLNKTYYYWIDAYYQGAHVLRLDRQSFSTAITTTPTSSPVVNTATVVPIVPACIFPNDINSGTVWNNDCSATVSNCKGSDYVNTGNQTGTQTALNSNNCQGSTTQTVTKSCTVDCPCSYTYDGDPQYTTWTDNTCTANASNCKLGDFNNNGIKSGTQLAQNSAKCVGNSSKSVNGSCSVNCPCLYDKGSILQDTSCTRTAGAVGTYKGHFLQTNGPYTCSPSVINDVSCNVSFVGSTMVSTPLSISPLLGGFQPNYYETFQSYSFKEGFDPNFNLNNVTSELNKKIKNNDKPEDVISYYEANLLEAISIFNNEYNSYITQCVGKEGTFQPSDANNPANPWQQVSGPSAGTGIRQNCNDIQSIVNGDRDLLNAYITLGTGYPKEQVKNKTMQKQSHYDNSYNNIINTAYPQLLKQRTELDNKLKDLYDLPGSKLLDYQYNYDSTIYTGVLLTILASALVYYTFTKLE
jgi:hypothetical protein